MAVKTNNLISDRSLVTSFNYLDARNLASSKRVSKRWQHLIDIHDNEIWRTLSMAVYPDTVAKMRKTPLPHNTFQALATRQWRIEHRTPSKFYHVAVELLGDETDETPLVTDFLCNQRKLSMGLANVVGPSRTLSFFSRNNEDVQNALGRPASCLVKRDIRLFVGTKPYISHIGVDHAQNDGIVFQTTLAQNGSVGKLGLFCSLPSPVTCMAVNNKFLLVGSREGRIRAKDITLQGRQNNMVVLLKMINEHLGTRFTSAQDLRAAVDTLMKERPEEMTQVTKMYEETVSNQFDFTIETDAPVNCMQASPSHVLAGCEDGKIRLVTLIKPTLVREYSCQAPVTCMQKKKGKLFAGENSREGTIYIFDFKTGQLERRFSQSTGPIHSLVVHNQILWTGGEEGTPSRRDLTTDMVTKLPDHWDNRYPCFRIRILGDKLAFCNRESVTICDLEKNDEAVNVSLQSQKKVIETLEPLIPLLQSNHPTGNLDLRVSIATLPQKEQLQLYRSAWELKGRPVFCVIDARQNPHKDIFFGEENIPAQYRCTHEERIALLQQAKARAEKHLADSGIG